MNVPSGSLCLISLEAVTPHGALFWGKYPLGRRLGSGLLAVGVGLGVGWGWIAFLLARQLRGLGLQNLEMSQPQTLGRLGADRAHRPRLAENSEIGGVANSSPSIHAARSSSVLKFL